MNNKKRNRKGFTIVELSIVIAVIAILAAVMIPTFSNMAAKAKNTALLSDLKNEYTSYTVVAGADYVDTIVINYDGKYYEIKNGVPTTGENGIVVEKTGFVPAEGVSYFCAKCDKVVNSISADNPDTTEVEPGFKWETHTH